MLADGLKACQLCGNPLHLKDCVGEKKFGLAHILSVRCFYSECGLVNDVPTGSRHKTSTCTSAWDVNTKLAAGITFFLFSLICLNTDYFLIRPTNKPRYTKFYRYDKLWIWRDTC